MLAAQKATKTGARLQPRCASQCYQIFAIFRHFGHFWESVSIWAIFVQIGRLSSDKICSHWSDLSTPSPYIAAAWVSEWKHQCLL